MRIEHIALWTDDIERLCRFYTQYFGASAGLRYVNANKGFESCFLSFKEGARLEVMKTTMLDPERSEAGAQRFGLTHLAISVGSPEEVDGLTRRLEKEGYQVVGQPRRTGDGYYESVVLDPDGNRIEITA